MGSSTWAFSRIGLSNTDMRGIASQPDVEAIEAQGCPPDLPESTYEMLRRAARKHPEASALSFFERATDYDRPATWSYRQLFAKVTRTANMFHCLGAGKDCVIAFVLPNRPETHEKHYAVAGAEPSKQ